MFVQYSTDIGMTLPHQCASFIGWEDVVASYSVSLSARKAIMRKTRGDLDQRRCEYYDT